MPLHRTGMLWRHHMIGNNASRVAMLHVAGPCGSNIDVKA